MGSGTALVTGGSFGFGYELARQAAADGRELLLVARDLGRLEHASAVLREDFGVNAFVFSQDLGARGAAEAVVAEVKRRGLEVEVLMNNAGFAHNGHFREQDSIELESMVQTNVMALTMLTRLLLPDMIARKRGRILNVASIAGFLPGPLMATYHATKAYVVSFTEALAMELRGSGVTATVVCPGVMLTGFQARAQLHDRSPMLHSPMAMPASRAAKIAYRNMMSGKAISVPGALNAMSAYGAVHAPHAISLPIVKSLHEPPRRRERSS